MALKADPFPGFSRQFPPTPSEVLKAIAWVRGKQFLFTALQLSHSNMDVKALRAALVAKKPLSRFPINMPRGWRVCMPDARVSSRIFAKAPKEKK